MAVPARLLLGLLTLGLPFPDVRASGGSGSKPNLLWITVEDMSPDLGCYGDAGARTPRIDALARESIRFTHAFAAAPVCSPSRFCLFTGQYPVTAGTHPMRSEFPVPAGTRGFPAYLREAGYFTTNRVKTDYNCADAERLIADAWNESSPTAHWRHPDRKPGQPFFAVCNDMTTHQSRSMTWPYESFVRHVQSELRPEQIRDPGTVRVPPYVPDTPTVRRTLARYADCITAMDGHVGALLDELEADGLTEDTIVCFFSDHGAGLPRHKRLLHDSGMRVPLLVRIPAKFRHLAPAGGEPGEVSDRLVRFVDFAPTMLRLAGVEVPASMPGSVFLGPRPDPAPAYVYGSRDRIDEVFETMRSLRDHRYSYLRNYLPGQSYAAPSAYSDAGEIQQDLAQVFRERPEALTAAQRDYSGPRKPAEALYDTESDPDQVRNLLDAPELSAEVASVLERFRKDFRRIRSELRDTGCLPEDGMWTWIREEGVPLGDIVAGRTEHRPDLEQIWAAADRVGTRDVAGMRAGLASDIPEIRFWSVLALEEAEALGAGGQAERDAAAVHLEDISLPVRCEAARWLASADEDYRDRAVAVLIAGLEQPDGWNILHACRNLERLGDRARAAIPAMRMVHERTRHVDGGDGNLFLAFSSGAFLAALGEPVPGWDFSPEGGPLSLPGSGSR